MFDTVFGPIAKRFSGIQLVREDLGDGRVRVTCKKYGFGGEYKLTPETKAMDEFVQAEHAKTVAMSQDTGAFQTFEAAPKVNKANLVPDETNQDSV